MSQYHANQLSNIDNATRTMFDNIQIQITLAGVKTNWMNITGEQFKLIKQILVAGE